ncbi:MAG: TonB-dependent receptor, partial [Campylobacterota bacterium]|nr:TonB-dependent receptor [Campylobacterota bacterium]
IGAEQFSKQGDSSAAGALKRVTGITIMDGKYVYIRGLGERYSSVLLNNLQIPSPEPTKRIVPLDIFPTGVIESMNIQKTYSPDIPGNFGGGLVNITTKNIPQEDNYFKLSFSTSYKDGVTGNSAIYNNFNGGSIDYLKGKSLTTLLGEQGYYLRDYLDNASQSNLDNKNFEDIKEAANQAVVDFEEHTKNYCLENSQSAECTGLYPTQRQNFASQLQNKSYGLTSKELKPGTNVAVSIGQGYKTSSGIRYGFTGSLYHKEDADYKISQKYNYNSDIVTGNPTQKKYFYETDSYFTTLEKKYGGLASLLLDTQTGHRVKYTKLYLKDFEDDTLNYLGFTDASAIQENYQYTYFERELDINQLTGQNSWEFKKSSLFKSLDLTWGYEDAKAKRDEPGSVTYGMFYDLTQLNDSDDPESILSDPETELIVPDGKLSFVTSGLNDSLKNFNIATELKNDNYKIKFGLETMKKERDFEINTISFNIGPNIFDSTKGEIDNYIDNYSNEIYNIDEIREDPTIDYTAVSSCFLSKELPSYNECLAKYSVEGELTGYEISINDDYLYMSSNPLNSSNYSATQNILANYLMVDFNPIESLNIIGGVRKEKLDQSIQFYSISLGEQSNNIDDEVTLPSLTLNYNYSENFIIRGGYSQTVTRPDFREYTESGYTDPTTGDRYVGNPDLKITDIKNYDIKFDYYLSHDEIVTLGLFKKEFQNPIETFLDRSSTVDRYGFVNAQKGDVNGWEIDFRKKFDFIDEDLSNFFVAGNYAQISSSITLNRDDKYQARLTNESRAMQGQSPYVINAQLGYDNLNTKDSVVLTYNEFGDRIVGVGFRGQELSDGTYNVGYPDAIEKAYGQLDLVIKSQLNDNYNLNEKKASYTFSFKAQNLLDGEKKVMQGSNILKKYKKGRSYSIGLSYKF